MRKMYKLVVVKQQMRRKEVQHELQKQECVAVEKADANGHEHSSGKHSKMVLSEVRLRATVHEARGLKPRDTTFAGGIHGTRHAYVALVSGEEETSEKTHQPHRSHKFKTQVVKESLSPKWNESFEVIFSSVLEAVRIVVYDNRSGGDEEMGGLVVPLSAVALEADKAPIPKWHHISDQEGEVTGSVLVTLQVLRMQREDDDAHFDCDQLVLWREAKILAHEAMTCPDVSEVQKGLVKKHKRIQGMLHHEKMSERKHLTYLERGPRINDRADDRVLNLDTQALVDSRKSVSPFTGIDIERGDEHSSCAALQADENTKSEEDVKRSRRPASASNAANPKGSHNLEKVKDNDCCEEIAV
jgi:hypothetical protein